MLNINLSDMSVENFDILSYVVLFMFLLSFFSPSRSIMLKHFNTCFVVPCFNCNN